MPPEQLTAFWLIPASDPGESLQCLIDELAEQYDAPRFEAHMTIGGGNVAPERAGEILDQLAAYTAIELTIQDVAFSDSFTKTLYVQFRSSPELHAIAAELQRLIGGDYRLDPHLSLLYKNIETLQKEDLARKITLPCQHVRFDAVKAISTPDPIRTRAQVEAWRVLASRRLGEHT